MNAHAAHGPLAGVRVLEVGGIGPGPFAGMMLADAGAEVIRIDRAAEAGTAGAFASTHRVLGRGRRSVALDLKGPGGTEALLALADRSDIILEGYRPGVAEKLGFSPAVVLARNPRIVYGRMTGWGQDGPLAARAGHDINYIALSGALEPVAGADGAPVPPLNMLGDFGGGGMLLAFGVLAALLHARATGEGQVVDAAILDGTALLTGMHQSMLGNGLWGAPRGHNLFDGGAPFYGVYQTADGKWLSVGAIEPQFYAQLLAGLGLSGNERLAAQNDAAHWPELKMLIAERIRSKTRGEWEQIFDGTDACVTPVLAPGEAAEHPQLAGRGVYASRDGVLHPAAAPRFSATPSAAGEPSPLIGTDGEALLREAGLPAATIAELRASGTLG